MHLKVTLSEQEVQTAILEFLESTLKAPLTIHALNIVANPENPEALPEIVATLTSDYGTPEEVQQVLPGAAGLPYQLKGE